MVAADGGQRFCETIAHHHVDTNGMNKLLNMTAYGSTCCWEEMSILKSQLFTYKGEYRFVQHLVLKVKSQRGRLSASQALNIMFAANGQCMLEQFALQ